MFYWIARLASLMKIDSASKVLVAFTDSTKGTEVLAFATTDGTEGWIVATDFAEASPAGASEVLIPLTWRVVRIRA